MILSTIHTGIGNLGHLLVIISFVAAIASAMSYGRASHLNEISTGSWLKMGRGLFWLHGLAVLGTVITLFVIIYNNYFEYHYAWSHSSVNLAVHYIIACFWEGQEGSFLIWSFGMHC